MARSRSPQPAPKAPNGFVASATSLPTPSRKMAGQSEGWQDQAWGYWESVGELRSVAQWIGNVMSRAKLVVGKRDGQLIVPVTDSNDPGWQVLNALYGGPQGQSEMLQAYGTHLTVAGECYSVNRAADDKWFTLATGKVTQQGNSTAARKAKLRADYGDGAVDMDPQDLTIRLYTPHPRDPLRADSVVRASLSTLGQIVSYDAHIMAQIRSRLTGAGILFMSSEIDFPVPEGADPNLSPAQHFMAMLGEAMMTPVDNPGDPSALVPIVAMVPPEALGKQDLVKFWTELDAAVVEMRDAAIKRLALSLDVPAEVLLGVADANHWNAWLSEESAVKAHLEPRLGVCAYALTEQYLRPALQGQTAKPEDYFVLADTASIRLRPNRSSEAIELYNLGELAGESLRRETGFQETDKMEAPEKREWLLTKIATGSTSPEQTQAALKELGADLGPIIVTQQAVNTPPPDDLRTDTNPKIPVRELPERLDNDEALAAACHVLVYRALERAGNKLRNAHPRVDTTMTASADLYRSLSGDPDELLAGAWDCAPAILAKHTRDVAGVVDTLDFYVRGLLSQRRAPSEIVLATLIESRPSRLELEPVRA